MIPQESLLVTLVKLVDRIPVPPSPWKRERGRPYVYPDRLFLKALVIMIVCHLHRVHELLSVLEEPTAEMQALRALLMIDGRYPTRCTWERRLKAIPATLPAQIGCFGRYLVALIQPRATCGRAAVMDSTTLQANGVSIFARYGATDFRPRWSTRRDGAWEIPAEKRIDGMRALRLVREFDRHLLFRLTRPMRSETGAGDDDDVGPMGQAIQAGRGQQWPPATRLCGGCAPHES